MKVHTLPKHLVYLEEDGKNLNMMTVERNDFLTRMSEIEAKDGQLLVPRHIYDDALADTPLEDLWIGFHKTHVVYDEKYFKDIQQARSYAYRACKWFPSLPPELPTPKSLLYLPKDEEDALRFLEDHIEQYPFVRTCHMSPKDILKIPLFDNAKEAMDCLLKSERTGNLFSDPFCDDDAEEEVNEDVEEEEGLEDKKEGEEEGQCTKKAQCAKHLFIREKKEYEWEARCFWSHGRLTAVSMEPEMDEEEKEATLKFFARWGRDFPFYSAIVDIGKTLTGEGDRIELIEFNTFGPDMLATAGHFSWFEDVLILLYSKEPVFRGPGEWA